MDSGMAITDDNVVAINEQKVVELEIRVRQLERANVNLLIAKLHNEMLAIQNGMTYFNERVPRLEQEIAAAEARLAQMDKK